MRILVTNDDGTNSEGLWALAEALTSVGEVYVVAPDRDRSGISAAMTLLDVVRANPIRSPVEGVEAHAVEGTPADCVILAHEGIYDEPFDIIFSGINQGANMGADVLLSGTVGAAVHGYLRGVPSVAVSSYYDPEGSIRYESACIGAAAIARELLASPIEAPLLLNVNMPDVDPADVEGVEVTVPGRRAFLESVQHEVVGRREHYWIKHNRSNSQPGSEEGTDVWAVRNNRVSISSISPLLTDGIPGERLERLAEAVRCSMKTSGSLA